MFKQTIGKWKFIMTNSSDVFTEFCDNLTAGKKKDLMIGSNCEVQ